MAYNDDALRSKLSTLNETQESIVSVSQWIAFHRRYADKIAQVWLARLKDVPPPKRLNFIYLVNDIVQNAKARKRSEFPTAFSPIIAEAVQQAYRSATQDVQGKIRRVLDVWKQRAVFEESILAAVSARIDEVDKGKGKGKKLLGNSLFSGSGSVSVPKELESLAPLQTAVSRAEFASKPLVENARSEYAKVFDHDVPQPSPPVHAANLSSLIKKLASTEASLNETIKARTALVSELRRLLTAAETELQSEEQAALDFAAKRTIAETSKRDVEDVLMRGLSETPQLEEETRDFRPDVEELTPEPEAESFEAAIPSRNPGLQGLLAGFGSPEQAPVQHQQPQSPVGLNGTGPPSNKKRKLSHDIYASEGMVPDLGGLGVDAIDSNDYNPSMQGFPANTMSNTMGFESLTLPDAKPAPTPDLASTLEEDVDALIRGANVS